MPNVTPTQPRQDSLPQLQAVEADGLSPQGMGWPDTGKRRGLQRPFDHHPAGAGGKGCTQKRRLVRAGPFHQLQQLELLPYLGTLPPHREHGIQQHHFGRPRKPLQQLCAVSRAKPHTPADNGQFRLLPGPAEPVFQQGGDQGIVLEEYHLKTSRSQKAGIFAQPCGGIHRKGCSPFLPPDPGRLEQQLAPESPRLQAGQQAAEIGPQHVRSGHVAQAQGQAVCIQKKDRPRLHRPFPDQRKAKPQRQRLCPLRAAAPSGPQQLHGPGLGPRGGRCSVLAHCLFPSMPVCCAKAPKPTVPTTPTTVSSMPAAIHAIIPSRYHSSRFEGKPLALIQGKPMIQHVVERVQASALPVQVVVATDDERIARAVAAFGGQWVMTGGEHHSGTDRLAEAATLLGIGDEDIVVNIQGDQPLFAPEIVEQVAAPLVADPELPMATLVYSMTRPEEITNPNHVKTVFDRQGRALYFSRSPIPHCRDTGFSADTYYRHLGFYAYRKHFLDTFVRLPVGRWERLEKLEQLRALEYGYRIQVALTSHDSIEVDTPADIARVEAMLRVQD